MVRNDNSAAKDIRATFALPSAHPAPFYPQELYVLQRPTGPVAVYTQQWRALNLVWALAHRGGDGTALRNKQVVVVGAGAAGLTAAVAAALAGAHVRLLEQAGTPMSLQLGCEQRFLHPRFHYWPRRRSQSAAAALPLLTWSVGTAGEVADTIIDQFQRINEQLNKAVGEGFHPIDCIYHVRDIVCGTRQETPGGCLVGYKVENMETGIVRAKPDVSCDILIFAVGFGVERTVDGLAPRSYWRTDPLTQPSIGPSGKKLRVLVAGDGDAGAIDVLRAALRQFDHGPFIDRIIQMTMGNHMLRQGVEEAQEVVEAFLQKQKEKLQDEFSEKHDAVRTGAAVILNRKYEELLKDNRMPLDALSKYVRSLARTDVEVTWVGRLPFASALESYTLNRLLVWLVCKLLPHVTYVPQRSLRRVEPVPLGGAGVWLGYSAYLRHCRLANDSFQDEDHWDGGIWDDVIVRYGGIRPLQNAFGAWGRELHKRWEASARSGSMQNWGEPGRGVAAFFENALDVLYHPHGAAPPKICLKARCLGEVEGRTQTVDGVDWPLFLFKVWIDPPTPFSAEEAKASMGARRANDWVEYHLHPYRKGIRRRANRGPEGDFSLLIFSRDDYWIDASLKDGRRLAGGWLSNLLGEDPPKSLIDCAAELWEGYSAETLPPTVLKDNEIRLDFERELARAPDDQAAETSARS